MTISKALQRLLLALSVSLAASSLWAQDPEPTPSTPDPHAAHHTPAPATAGSQPVESSAPTPETPAEKPQESTPKGLVVHRAPDFCMKKDPPPHCAE